MKYKCDLEEVAPEVCSSTSVKEVCLAVAKFLKKHEDKYVKNLLFRLKKCTSLEQAQADFYSFILAQSGLGLKNELRSIEKDHWPIPGKIWGD